ncbi:MAG TPA: hypothetical protein VK869_02885 [Rubrobacteraceae bacterium]|nr:hypothetical protein [Rubrobacteraceae bacterium]
MPGYERAEISAELTVVASRQGEIPPSEQLEAAKRAASESGLAREAGPETTALAGGRREVLEAAMRVAEAALDAGARAVRVEVEAQGAAPRFGEGD